MKDKILKWLANGETGISSKTMAFCSLDIKYNDAHYPCDPSDFNRCLLLLEIVPEIKNHFNKIKMLSPQWNRLINNWDKIEKCFIDEVGFNWSKGSIASKTYDLIKSIINNLPNP